MIDDLADMRATTIDEEFGLRSDAAGPLKAHLGYLLQAFGRELTGAPPA